jgi:hypothetical protein
MEFTVLPYGFVSDSRLFIVSRRFQKKMLSYLQMAQRHEEKDYNKHSM